MDKKKVGISVLKIIGVCVTVFIVGYIVYTFINA